VNVRVALAAVLASPAAIAERRDEGAPRALDVPGATTATLGLASLIYVVSEIPDNGWASPATLGFGAAGVLLLALSCWSSAARRRRWFRSMLSGCVALSGRTLGSSCSPWSACRGSTC
jgi:hypothetical protein